MKRKIIHSLNYEQRRGETNTLPSLTVPDQSISLHRLLRDFTIGQNVQVYGTEVFNEDFDLPDPRSLDLTEIQERREELIQRKSELDAVIRNSNAQGAGSAQTEEAPDGKTDDAPEN